MTVTVADLDVLPERLRSKIAFGPVCWEWLAYRPDDGYGRYRCGPGSPRLAHRVVYELLVGPIPEGLQLDHLCRVRHCVNPDHLEPVTGRVNVLRGDTVVAANAAKVECDSGHAFDAVNTYVRTNGGRLCRTCRRVCEATRRQRMRPNSEEEPMGGDGSSGG